MQYNANEIMNIMKALGKKATSGVTGKAGSGLLGKVVGGATGLYNVSEALKPNRSAGGRTLDALGGIGYISTLLPNPAVKAVGAGLGLGTDALQAYLRSTKNKKAPVEQVAIKQQPKKNVIPNVNVGYDVQPLPTVNIGKLPPLPAINPIDQGTGGLINLTPPPKQILNTGYSKNPSGTKYRTSPNKGIYNLPNEVGYNNQVQQTQPQQLISNKQQGGTTSDVEQLINAYQQDRANLSQPYIDRLSQYIEQYPELQKQSMSKEIGLRALGKLAGIEGLGDVARRYTPSTTQGSLVDLEKALGEAKYQNISGMPELYGNIAMANQLGIDPTTALAGKNWTSLYGNVLGNLYGLQGRMYGANAQLEQARMIQNALNQRQQQDLRFKQYLANNPNLARYMIGAMGNVFSMNPDIDPQQAQAIYQMLGGSFNNAGVGEDFGDAGSLYQ